MALHDTLPAPFTVPPSAPHTHTFVFLHRFPATTTDNELPLKVLSSKRTKNHKTLATQFPTIRWVFPFAKTGARPYGNLTAADKAAVGLSPSATPYITQVLLQEAQRVGGLDNVILGGQGETAVSAHEAMGCFPEIPGVLRKKGAEAVAEFLKETFHADWDEPLLEPRLAGFVGMHGEGREVTRDISAYAVAGKLDNSRETKVNVSIVANTTHRFIRGGYKVTTATWDGKRIDEVAEFLEGLGVPRVVDEEERANKEVLDVKKRERKEDNRDEFEVSARDKYLEELAKDKKANETLIAQVRRRIEADKATRQYRLDREREARRAREEAAAKGKKTQKEASVEDRVLAPGGWGDEDEEREEKEEKEEEEAEDEEEEEEEEEVPRQIKRRKNRNPGRTLAEVDGREWEGPKSASGGVSVARMRALGLVSDKDEDKQF